MNIKDFVKLGGLVKVKGGKRIPKGLSYSDEETDFWYLRVDDIDASGNIKFHNLKHISSEIFDALKNYELKPNEVVVSIAGTIGKITLLEGVPAKRIILTENCAKLQIKSKNLSPKFLSIILTLPFVQKQMSLAYIQTTIPKLGLERIYNLKIPPVPSEGIQTRVIERLEAAYNAKRNKEAEAKSLLDGINAYLLECLGIKTPDRTETEKTFFTRASKLSGGRFDPFYHQVEFERNIEVVQNGKYKPKHLRQLIHQMIKGRLPKDDEKGGDNKVVQINSIRENGNIDTDNLLTAKDIFTSAQKMLRNDILVVITGATIGKIAIWEMDVDDYFLGGDIVKFQCIENVNPYFVFAWLRSINSQIEIRRNITGATNGHLSPNDVGNILIPLPEPELQNEIAAHVQTMRARAKELEREGRAEVERAKAEAEQMILGEVSTNA